MHPQCSPEEAYSKTTQRATQVTICFFNGNTKRITATKPAINITSKYKHKEQIKIKIKQRQPTGLTAGLLANN
jgi:hypothetical protein